jgi:hypothetical protein
MKDVAEKLKDISHNDEVNERFYTIANIRELDDLLQKLTIIDGFILVATSDKEGRYAFTNTKSNVDLPTNSFFIFKNASFGDIQAKIDVKNQTKEIGEKILSKMFNDQFNAQTQEETNALRYFDRDSIQYFSIGPILDNLYGTQFSFVIQEFANIQFNVNDWK